MPLRRVQILLAVAMLSTALPSSRRAFGGGETARPGVAPPRQNASYVPDDDEGMRATRKAVDLAVAAKDWAAAARGLQRLADGPREAVVLASESRVYEGAATAAHHQVLALGAATLAAYQAEFGSRAREALAAGIEARDEGRLAALVERWLPTSEARRAALLLADSATERGDLDAALGWFERLEDAETVAADDLAPEVARWREARLAREAVAYAADRDAIPRVRAWRAAPTSPPPAGKSLRRDPMPDGWPTSGGAPDRAAVVAPLGTTLSFGWVAPLHELPTAPGAGLEPAAPGHRPSPWLPPRAVASGDRGYASDGKFLFAFDLLRGTRAAFPVPLAPGSVGDDLVGERGIAARKSSGLIEGHALTASGAWVWCAVPEEPAAEDSGEGRGDFPAAPRNGPAALPVEPGSPVERGAPVEPGSPDAAARRGPRGSRVVAVHFSDGAGEVAWEAGGEAQAGSLPAGLNLYGAPLLYHGTLYVAGVKRAISEDRAESHLVALDPETGAVRWTTSLGAGEPIRPRRHDESIPSSCAAARGRIVVVTNLGIAAAVESHSGRTIWLYRYDRARPDGSDTRQRLDGEDREPGERRTSFSNEPPLLSGGRCFLAPTDARQLVALANRPIGRSRALTLWKAGRTEAFRNLAVEQLVGATDDLDEGDAPAGRDRPRALLVVAGQGYPTPGEIQTSVAGLDAATGVLVWDRALPSGGLQEPYGRAAMTATEVYVPTLDGIARYRLVDGTEYPFLGREAIPADRRGDLGEEEKPWGNLVPVAGRGLLAVNEHEVSWWSVR